MPKELQLDILGHFRGFPQDVRSKDLDRFGKLERKGKQLYRYRLGDYRVYFERMVGHHYHRIQQKHPERLLFKQPPTGEDQALQGPKFWN